MAMLVHLLKAVTIAAVVNHFAFAQLGLPNGFINLETPTFNFQLVRDSQTLYSLRPKSNNATDYIPSDVMAAREANGRYHLGDITFRARQVGSTAWVNSDSSTTRRPVTARAVSGNVLASSDMTPTLQSTALLSVVRNWVNNNGQLELQFTVTNSKTFAVEIGAIGAPLEFNNIFSNRNADATNNRCSFYDPYIGADAGYVQVTPLLGTLPALVVLPTSRSPLEAFRFLPESGSTSVGYQTQTYEGNFEWQFHTLAYAQNEWRSATPWNAPTSTTLQPGQSRTYGLQFRVAPNIRSIESTVTAAGRPLAVGVPGYIVGPDSTTKLHLRYGSAVANITVTPSGALTWTPFNEGLSSGWVGYTLKASAWGRARLSITYADGTLQTIHYYLTKNSAQAIADMGDFLTTAQWFNSTNDPFRRSPSVISYDRETNTQVINDGRAWIPGLSDEAGAGSYLAAVMKQYAQPNAAEVTKLEQFINQVLWGSVQNSDGKVKKSVYFYEPSLVPGYTYPSNINWGSWTSWNRQASYSTDRAYNYVHVCAAYWALYRVARNYPNLVTQRDWQWYINQAALTTTAMTSGGVGYVNVGLMGETVFKLLLDDLKREGLTSAANTLESRMRARWQVWTNQRFPFGSEMAWDSTGEEGVYAWSVHFNDTRTATNTVNAILAYQPTVAHWGYNGNARRYWDNIYGGKLGRYERQIHHYGSGLNALPLIAQFEKNPTDYYLLRTGFAGLAGALSNIDQGGFASASFHSFPDTLKWDGYSGDYGPNFSGHAMGTGTFIINHPDFGWQAFGGNVVSSSTTSVQVTVTDSARRKVFVAPLGARFELDAGVFTTVNFNPSTRSVVLGIAAAPAGVSGAAVAPNGRLLIKQIGRAHV